MVFLKNQIAIHESVEYDTTHFKSHKKKRGVAQPGSVLAWGASGRWFKSSRPDQTIK